jgi:hypothetical protein
MIWPSQGKKQVNNPLPDNLYLHYREKSWVDKEVMKKWISSVLQKRTRKIEPGKKGLLILDGFRAHLHSEVREAIDSCNFDIWVLPANTTPHLQPVDISVNRPFKFSYHLLWSAWFESKKDDDTSRPSKDRIIEWISRSWEAVSELTVLNGWKRYVEYHEAVIQTQLRK